MNSVRNASKIWDILHAPSFENDRFLGEIIRHTHSIEKGLSLENIRPGFGYAKITEAYNVIKRFLYNGGDVSAEPINMFMDALHSYLIYHKTINYTNDIIEAIKKIYIELGNIVKPANYDKGGIITINRSNYTREQQLLFADLFNNRHSIREFAHTSVNEDDLKSAIELAMRCPSACNRQCYRVHIVNKTNFSILGSWFDGVGGFADDIDKMIFITGKLSVYRPEELHQWIVTGSIYAAYLTLSLEIYNIGCCFIQRPVLPNERWQKIATSLGAKEDEQLICCMGIGNIKEKYTVPVSHRLYFDTIVNYK